MKAICLNATALHPEETRSNKASSAWKNPIVSLVEIPKPQPKPDEILIRISYCGICGSDFHLTSTEGENKNIAYPGLLELPMVLGHEFSGIVEAHGSTIDEKTKQKFAIGTLVTAEEMLWCGHCDVCRSGHINHCENLEEIGFTRNGALSQYIALNPRYCWSLEPLLLRHDKDLALRLGALVEPYAVSFRALFQGAHSQAWVPGQKVLIFGAGPIGLAAIDLALTCGAAEVIAVETDPHRRIFASQFVQTLSPEKLDELQNSFDWIIDAAGATKLISKIAAKHLKIGGTVCLIARTDEPGLLNSENLITSNARIFGSQGHSGDATFPRVIDLMSTGRLRAEKIIHSIVSLEEAQLILKNQEKKAGKILVHTNTL